MLTTQMATTYNSPCFGLRFRSASKTRVLVSLFTTLSQTNIEQVLWVHYYLQKSV